MTADEAKDLATLCRQLLPLTTDQQAALLANDVLPPLEYRLAKDALRRHALAEEEQRLNFPRFHRILRELQALTPADRVSRATAEATRQTHGETQAQAAAAASLRDARAFCTRHQAELEGWREELLRRHPFLEKHLRGRGRDTFESPTLVGLIYREFHGRAGDPINAAAVGTASANGDAQ